MRKMCTNQIPLIICSLLLMFLSTACIPSDPNFDTVICKNGVIKLVPHDSTETVCFHSNYACGISFEDESKYTDSVGRNDSIGFTSNGSFQLIDAYTFRNYDFTIHHACAWLPSANRSEFTDYDINQCGYENPDYVVIYCNENDELTISDKTCAEYINTPNGTFMP